MTRRLRMAAGLVALAVGLQVATAEPVLPAGFRHIEVAAGLNPTCLAFAPDGRILVAEKHGKVRVIKDGKLLPEAALSVETNITVESGLLSLAVDPGFAGNGYIYLFYKPSAPVLHNRLSRFTMAGNAVVPGSETILLDLAQSASEIHNGGTLAFGKDGKLYLAYGDDGHPDSVLSMASLRGKVLRFNPDGSIPEDNPYYAAAVGIKRAIYAFGLRNPFSSAVHPVTGRHYVMDVGSFAFEEINEVAPGANFGWPAMEGPQGAPPASPGKTTLPVHHYGHSEGQCISGGAFYAPKRPQFPKAYEELFFFGDYYNGWIKTFDPVSRQVKDFLKGVMGVDPRPVSMAVGPDGSLYYVSRGQGPHSVAFAQYTLTGKVFRIEYGPAMASGKAGIGSGIPTQARTWLAWMPTVGELRLPGGMEAARAYDLEGRRISGIRLRSTSSGTWASQPAGRESAIILWRNP